MDKNTTPNRNGNKKPEDIYLGTEPAAQDPEEFAEAEPI